MCNIWKPKSDDMSCDEIAEIAKTLAHAGVSYVHLQGGDPTMRKDLLEIVDIFNKVKIKPTVITNGILLKEKLAEGLAGRHCNVSVSLDSLNPEIYRYIRGVDKLDTVIENVRNAPVHRNGNWSLATTVTGLSTIEEIKGLERFASDNNFMYAIRPYVHTLGTAGREDDRLVYHNIEQTVDIFRYMRDRARENNYLASILYEEGIRYVRGEPFPICDAMRRSMVMSPLGLFAPCIEFTDKSEELSRMFSQKKIWLERCSRCNDNTPCFYNDVREIGILWKRKWKILPHFFTIISQMIKYGNFF
jgi:MoaA/NifB/PqqE/SkfB family radical SAM enzyme